MSVTKPVLEGVALRRAVHQVMEEFLDLDRYDIFIFGSEASGLGTVRSDIDVGVLGQEPVPNAVIQRIRERLEGLRTLRIFDLVDFSRVDESFKAEALKHVERL